MPNGHRLNCPAYHDETHFYSWEYDAITRRYDIIKRPIDMENFDDRVPLGTCSTKKKAVLELDRMYRQHGLTFVTREMREFFGLQKKKAPATVQR